MRLGKHCFCQKPLTHSIYEARRLGEIARDKKLATQMGNQGTASSGLRNEPCMVRWRSSENLAASASNFSPS